MEGEQQILCSGNSSDRDEVTFSDESLENAIGKRSESPQINYSYCDQVMERQQQQYGGNRNNDAIQNVTWKWVEAEIDNTEVNTRFEEDSWLCNLAVNTPSPVEDNRRYFEVGNGNIYQELQTLKALNTPSPFENNSGYFEAGNGNVYYQDLRPINVQEGQQQLDAINGGTIETAVLQASLNHERDTDERVDPTYSDQALNTPSPVHDSCSGYLEAENEKVYQFLRTFNVQEGQQQLDAINGGTVETTVSEAALNYERDRDERVDPTYSDQVTSFTSGSQTVPDASNTEVRGIRKRRGPKRPYDSFTSKCARKEFKEAYEDGTRNQKRTLKQGDAEKVAEHIYGAITKMQDKDEIIDIIKKFVAPHWELCYNFPLPRAINEAKEQMHERIKHPGPTSVEKWPAKGHPMPIDRSEEQAQYVQSLEEKSDKKRGLRRSDAERVVCELFYDLDKHEHLSGEDVYTIVMDRFRQHWRDFYTRWLGDQFLD